MLAVDEFGTNQWRANAMLKEMKTTLILSIAGLILLVCGVNGTTGAQTLTGRAVLPADTFAPGPASGQFIGPANGRTPPFAMQPVQGISAVLQGPGGSYLVMCDNGFGAKSNSADFVLRVYRLDPDFKTKSGGTGSVNFEVFFTLRDPDHKINFPIIAELAKYPSSTIDVDPVIRNGRLLTGADFDIESFRRANDGTFWFGDEFGPFLLHTDASGRALEAPFPLAGVASPDDPLGRPANLPSSRGFEGMALIPNGKSLYPLLEGSLTTDPDQHRLIINEFDLATKSYTGRQWFYRLEQTISTGQSIGDFTAVSDHRFLVIERDGGQGASAHFKKIFLVDFDQVDSNGFLVKNEIVDLLNIADPDDIAGTGTGVFTFPFVTIESVIPLSATSIGVINDNNYPFSSGRVVGQPDNNEFIIIKLNRPLSEKK